MLGEADLPEDLDPTLVQSMTGGLASPFLFGGAFDVGQEKQRPPREAQQSTVTERRLREAMERFAEAYGLWDEAGRLVLCNAPFRGLKALTFDAAQTALGQPIEIESDAGRTFQVRAEKLKDGSLVAVGQDLTDILEAAAVVENRQALVGEAAADMETALSTIEHLRTQLAKKAEEAERAEQVASGMLSNVSHELKTPLNAIIGFSQILEGDSEAKLSRDKYRDYAGDILMSGNHLLDLVDEILLKSSLDAGRVKLTPDDVNPTDLIEAGLRASMADARRKNIKIVRKQKNGALPTAFADYSVAKRVFEQLLANAIKFTPDGGQITIVTAATAKDIGFSIIDTGTGMPQEALEASHAPFVPNEALHAKAHPGLGLGLAIARQIVALHGGDLTIQSSTEEGTQVTFTLPRDEKAIPLENLSEDFLEAMDLT
ncbi:MAG: HAMP domain-containing sensor histidine kinase, partial [Pseudomonadota bacterium]